VQESHDLGSKPSVSVMWLTHGGCPAYCVIHSQIETVWLILFAHFGAGESMPANVQCAQVARIQAAMPWVQAGTDFFDGSHIVCNETVPQ
jgi:hypothetical protein